MAKFLGKSPLAANLQASSCSQSQVNKSRKLSLGSPTTPVLGPAGPAVPPGALGHPRQGSGDKRFLEPILPKEGLSIGQFPDAFF